ncbi:MAG: DUF664 domain-containing protein [Actinobacteria bacterium]|nr:DUF664 domain-containing protein [Actinomycetota bacterium]
MISTDDFLYFVDDAIDGMIAIVSELGDDLANRRLDVPGGNSPYAVLTHCLGVMEYWGGAIVAGRAIERDREAEFVAAGDVATLVRRAGRAREQLAADVSLLDGHAAPRGTPRPEDASVPIGRTQGGALLHLYKELAQHRGQMETCRDVLLAPWTRYA